MVIGSGKMSARSVEAGIYRITHTASGRHYVGSAAHIRRRWAQHRAHLRRGIHHAVKLQRAWAKHGEQAFEFCVLEVVEDLGLLVQREQYWIDALGAHQAGMNSCPVAGRSVGYVWSDEQRARASESKRGTVFTDAHREAISQALTGMVFSEERKAKIRAKALERAARDPDGAAAPGRANKGRKWTDEQRAKILAARAASWTPERRQAAAERAKGRKHSAEAKAKIAAANSARGVSEETRQKMREALTGRKLSPEHAEKSRQQLQRLRDERGDDAGG